MKSLVKKYNTVEHSRIVVFVKTYCRFSHQVKAFFHSMDLYPKYIDISKEPGGYTTQELQDSLERLTSRRTVPRVFVNGTCIGGYEATLRYFEDHAKISYHREKPINGDIDVKKYRFFPKYSYQFLNGASKFSTFQRLRTDRSSFLRKSKILRSIIVNLPLVSIALLSLITILEISVNDVKVISTVFTLLILSDLLIYYE